MKQHDEMVDRFWAGLRRADREQGRLAYGLETRVMARLREQRRAGPLSLLQLAGRCCLAACCALLLLGLYVPLTVNTIEFADLVEAVANDEQPGLAGLFTGDAP
ncbi:MAG: hypothetical protein LBK76_09335 [Verrucomicrobiales bacterium]|jgi:hypothetical protein|nr:hypothetical protein [Verrucomicrobiales bacterium]